MLLYLVHVGKQSGGVGHQYAPRLPSASRDTTRGTLCICTMSGGVV